MKFGRVWLVTEAGDEMMLNVPGVPSGLGESQEYVSLEASQYGVLVRDDEGPATLYPWSRVRAAEELDEEERT